MPDTIKRQPVKSSNIKEMGHCPITNRMTVMFNNGSKFCYSDVPTDLYEKVIKADSIGSAHHELIKKTGKQFKKF